MEQTPECEVWPFPASTTERYVLQCVSSETPRRITFGKKPIECEVPARHLIFKITLAVTNTSRAAMAEYFVVIRPPLIDRDAFKFIERVSAVRNEVGNIDVNMPKLFFDKADNTLKVCLEKFATQQRVAVEITKWFDNAPSINGRQDPASDIPANEVNDFPPGSNGE